MEREADGTLVFRRPNGWDIPAVPDPPVLTRDPMAVIWEANREHSVVVDEDTLRPGWLGEKLDVGYAIAVLHPQALRPSEVITVGGPLEEPLGIEEDA